MSDRPIRFGFLLLENFTLISLAATIDPLRMANQLSGKTLYEWYTITEDNLPLCTSGGIEISPDSGLRDHLEFDAVFVVGGVGITQSFSKEQIRWICKIAASGSKLGGICTGSYVLAHAGLLDDYQCSIHWEYLPLFQEEFPKARCTNHLYSIDRSRYTASGGTAAMDMMLRLIGYSYSSQLSVEIADMFVQERIRTEVETQKTPLRYALGTSQPKLSEAVGLMESNIEEVLSVEYIAVMTGISLRQLERLFRRYLDCSPSKYYMDLRLQRARQLLKNTSMTILEVGLACGFSSSSRFSKVYHARMGLVPSKEKLGIMQVNRSEPNTSQALSLEQHPKVYSNSAIV